MKKTLLPILTLVILLIVSLWNGWFLRQQTLRWQLQLRQAAEDVRAGAWERAEAALEEGFADWNGYQTYLRVVANHDEVDAAEELYVRARTLAETRETSELLSELAALQTQLWAAAEMEQLSARNIL